MRPQGAVHSGWEVLCDGRYHRMTKRIEDPRLLRGEGMYAGDARAHGLLHLALVRSPLARAKVVSVDVEAARRMPGVVTVLTADDLPDAALLMQDWVPADLTDHRRPVLVRAEVASLGDALAAVVAESEYQAHDAAQAVVLDLDPLGSALLPADLAGTEPGPAAPQLARTQRFQFGDAETAFARAAAVVRRRLRMGRVQGGAMEPRASFAVSAQGRLFVRASTQSVYNVRAEIARRLQLAEDQVRVVAEDVGGGFGPKGTVYPEDILVAFVAWQLGRPVRWVATRSEDGATTAQAHGTDLDLELAADAEGRILGLRGEIVHDAGPYATAGVNQPYNFVTHMISAYRLPALDLTSRAYFTNTVVTGFVRGGGRPVGNFAIERMLDALAAEVGKDAVEIRRLNVIHADEMPYATGLDLGGRTMVYDSGDYPALLEAAWSEIERERPGEEPAPASRLQGVGVAMCVEQSGFGNREPARAQLGADGLVHLHLGSTPQGQGHRTMAALLFAERLGWPLERVVVHLADTDQSPPGGLTAGSRSAMHVGNAVAMAANGMRDRLLELAAAHLEVDPADLEIEAGQARVRGVPARIVELSSLVPAGGIELQEHWLTDEPAAYSAACHACRVRVDQETGAVEVVRYVISHDVGRMLDPEQAEGQIHGGWAHGLGMALLEESLFDADGAHLSSSFLDYRIPAPPEVASPLALLSQDHPSPNNPEGLKGIGENGTIPVPACVAQAVEDALRQVNPRARIQAVPISAEEVLAQLRG